MSTVGVDSVDTTTSEAVHILIVDNEPERHEGLTNTADRSATFTVRVPEDVDDEDLRSVDLVSVDEYLGDEWNAYLTTSGLSRSLHNLDGLSVAASFRSQGRAADNRFGVSLHTADLDKLSSGLPRLTREPLTAAQHDLDWVFAWQDAGFGDRLVSLARAVRSAATSADHIRTDFGASWLGLDRQPWHELARREIEDCRPPAHGLSVSTQGASFVRWLAQRILPYPTFLLDRDHAATLLGIQPDSFDALAEILEDRHFEAKFDGPLRDFAGARWWRAALLHLLAEFGVEHWDPNEEKTAAMSAALGVDLEAMPGDAGVVTYDAAGNVTGVGVASSQAVRIQTDGWPVYADDPWALLEDVADDPTLALLVGSTDRWRLNGQDD